jgi:hypothetical protein
MIYYKKKIQRSKQQSSKDKVYVLSNFAKKYISVKFMLRKNSMHMLTLSD